MNWPQPRSVVLSNPRGSVSTEIDPNGYSRFGRIGSGFRCFDGCMLYLNGEPGAGVIEFDTLIVRYDRPLIARPERTGWRVSGDTLTIGRGNECIVARGILPIRVNFRADAPSMIPYGPKMVRWAPTQKSDIRGPIQTYLKSERSTGLWAPLGKTQAAPPGADDRATVSGYEQDGPGFVLKSDLLAERMAMACINPTTGQPTQVRDDGYAADRGWNGAGQHAAFKPYHSSVAGAFCPYRDWMSGVQRDSGMGPFDPEHSGNALSHWIAAAHCGDQAAGFYIELLANDISMAKYGLERMARGGRAYAWTGMTMFQSNAWHTKALAMRDELKAFGRMRAGKNYSFNPTPQSRGMPPDMDSCQLMEDMLNLSFLCMSGVNDVGFYWNRLHNSPAPYSVKFIATGRNQTEVFDVFQNPCGEGDYFNPWVLYGIIAHLEGGVSPELAAYLIQTVPPNDHRTYPDLRSLRDAFRALQYGKEQCALLWSVLEGMVL